MDRKPLAEYQLKRKEDLIQLSSKYGLICWYCGIDLENIIHIDHITPKSKGGSDEIENKALACCHCNMAKWTYSKEEFLEYIKYLRSEKFNSVFL